MVSSETFERCCRDSYSSLYKTALWLVRDPHLAEDVLQEALIKGYQALADLRDPTCLAGWLYQILVREALEALRARKVWYRRSAALEGNIPSEASSPAEEAVQTEQRQLIWCSLEMLSPGQRTAFVLCGIEGRCIRETAECMRISEGAVKRHLQRARNKLRKRLRKILGENGGKA